jgi:hypothetical protein
MVEEPAWHGAGVRAGLRGEARGRPLPFSPSCRTACVAAVSCGKNQGSATSSRRPVRAARHAAGVGVGADSSSGRLPPPRQPDRRAHDGRVLRRIPSGRAAPRARADLRTMTQTRRDDEPVDSANHFAQHRRRIEGLLRILERFEETNVSICVLIYDKADRRLDLETHRIDNDLPTAQHLLRWSQQALYLAQAVEKAQTTRILAFTLLRELRAASATRSRPS